MPDLKKNELRRCQVEVLSDASNQAVVRMAGRNFPGLVLQGDSLKNLLLVSQRVGRRLGEVTDQEDEDLWAAQELCDNLLGLVLHYQRVLESHGQGLPYPSRVSVDDRLVLVDEGQSEELEAG